MSTITRISPAEAHAKMAEGYTYVDVRSEPEFQDGHPEGAVNVPLLQQAGPGMAPNPDFLKVMTTLFAKDAKMVLGCRSGGRSMKAGEMLLGAGYGPLLEQRAGWDGARDAFGQVLEAGWSRAGLPVATGAPTGTSYADLKKKAGL